MNVEPPATPPTHRLRIIRKIAWISVAFMTMLFVGIYGWRVYQDANPPTAKQVARAAINSEFELLNHHGITVTGETYRGKWQIVFFGYTYCPDICPTTLNTIAETLDALGDDAEQVAPLFITVDPKRDTPAILAEFVAAFHPKLIGLTGTQAQIKAAAHAFKAYYSKAEQPDAPDGYLMGHSGYIYLMTPEGEFESLFTDQRDTSAKIAAAIRIRLKNKKD